MAEKRSSDQTSMTLQGDREIVIARTFNAPARLVFDAWTKAELVKRWFAPKSRGVELVECTAEVKVDGAYRYVMQRAGSEPFAFSGKYLEVTPHSKLVYTQTFEPMAAAGYAEISVTFAERDGKTHLVSTERYPSAAVRTAAIESGMESGMRETIDQLDSLVSSLSSPAAGSGSFAAHVDS